MKAATKTWAVCGLLLLAGFLRVWTLGYDLPYVYHPDEPVNVDITQRIFKSGDFNPHFFGYPSLFYYVNEAVHELYYVTGKLAGTLQTRSDVAPLTKLAMGVTSAPQPGLILVSRAVTVAFGLGTVLLTYMLGVRLLGDRRAAALGALITAVAPTNVALSRLITPDTFVAFFVVASVLAATYVAQAGKSKHYAFCGLLVGLAASTKYNGGLVVLALVVAHLLGPSAGARRHWRLGLGLLACVAGFLLGSPFALLDSSTFLGYLRWEGSHYATGHPGMEGKAVAWYLAYMWSTAGVVYVFAVLEIIRGLVSRSKAIALLAAFPVAYFVFIGSFEVRNDRTFLPLTPLLFLLAASFVTHVLTLAGALRSPTWRRIAVGIVSCVVLVAVLQPAVRTFQDTERLIAGDSRKTARIWIGENLPPGARIAIESYSPFVDPGRYSVGAFGRITDHEPEWYRAQGFQYVIVSEGMYGRFFREPDRYPKQVADYNVLFASLTPLKIFPDGGYEIRIYKTNAGAADAKG
jgi:4-amino-4-deoxy-L-arabinose transferase-like glycosyltransferase